MLMNQFFFLHLQYNFVLKLNFMKWDKIYKLFLNSTDANYYKPCPYLKFSCELPTSVC